jgi:ABC-type Zn uptake system ZnuABC Zn-binding protein ZnuA
MNSTTLLAAMASIALAAPVGAGPYTAPASNSSPDAADGPNVVTSLTTYAAIAREIVGDRGEVAAIANGAENPHFVTPRPSLLLRLRRADMFVVTGLDLELWVPTMLDKAGNAKVRPGAPGYVNASAGVPLLEVPTSTSRTEGDVHVYGNPHIWTSPVNAVIVGRNILDGLKRVSPENAAYYERRFAAWREKIVRELAGDELVDLLGVDAVYDLARQDKLLDFLASKSYEGRPLSDRLGGWMEQAGPMRGRKMVCYHREWVYFGAMFGVDCEAFIEPKPGIPPTPQHVSDVINLMRSREIHVLFSTNYFDRKQIESVAARTDATPVIVPANTEGAPGVETYSQLVSLWVTQLARAFAAHPAPASAGD